MDIFHLLLLGTPVLLVLAFAYLMRRLGNMKSLLGAVESEHKTELDHLRKEISLLNEQINEQQQRNIIAARQTEKAITQTEELASIVRELQLQDPATGLYHRATQLVKQGADIEDIMSACELPRAEVELLMSVHNKKSI